MRALPRPEDLGGGLWSVPVPIPGNPLGYTLVYALESTSGPVLIDAGWQHARSWRALSSGLAELGLNVADVYGVIVTHHHPDHSGLAGRVREASGAWIAMHAADIAVIRRFRKEVHEGTFREWQLGALRRAGASEAEIGQAELTGGRIDPPVIPDRELADGELADLPGRDLRVIHTPGHSPGHICLYLEHSARLFTGDHVLPKITPNIGLYAFEEADADPLADFLDSLAKVAAIGAAQALPAHEYRFGDVGARIDQIAAHHEERLGEVAAIVAAGPVRAGSAADDGATASGGGSVTLWEVASRMRWNVAWADMHPMLRGLAVGEAAAHLRLLQSRGQASLVPGSYPLRYVTADPRLEAARTGHA